ncbi:MAG: hypothetical protein WA130_16250 [Candidatus Methanoperedens sp.]
MLPAAPGDNIKAKVDIKPETINLKSKGKFTAFIKLPEDLNVRDIDVGTVVIAGAHVVNSIISNENGGTLIAKFNNQDLENVHTGNAVLFNVTGKVNGMGFEGSDRVKVIDNKNQKDVEECECDEHVKEDDHEDKKVNDHSDERNKKDDPKNNNNGRGNNAVITNNIYINNNSGTVTVNINNQGNSKTKGNNGNGRSQRFVRKR